MTRAKADGQVDGRGLQILQLIIHRQAQLHIGTAAAEAGQPRQQPAAGERGKQGHGDHPLLILATQLAPPLIQLRKALTQVGAQPFSPRRRLELPRGALKQQPQLALQLLDVLTDRRLGDEELLRRPAERAGPQHSLQNRQRL